jgi:hypothetical protein
VKLGLENLAEYGGSWGDLAEHGGREMQSTSQGQADPAIG